MVGKPVASAALSGPGARSRLAKVVPGLVASVLAFPVLALGQHFGFVTDLPLWFIGSGIAGGSIAAIVATLLWPPGGSRRAMLCRVTVCASSIGFMLYLTGWGAVLAVAFVFGALEEFRVEGARAARPMMVVAALATAGGELGVWAGWFHTFLPEPQGHGLAFLEVLAVWMILGFLALAYTEKQVEITERSALTDIDSTCSQLHELRALGVRVAIDDFGTGYSSLSYLKQLPIDVLKLDKSFVDGLDAGPADAAIVQAIVTMGHALGVKVTAGASSDPSRRNGCAISDVTPRWVSCGRRRCRRSCSRRLPSPASRSTAVRGTRSSYRCAREPESRILAFHPHWVDRNVCADAAQTHSFTTRAFGLESVVLPGRQHSKSLCQLGFLRC